MKNLKYFRGLFHLLNFAKMEFIMTSLSSFPFHFKPPFGPLTTFQELRTFSSLLQFPIRVGNFVSMTLVHNEFWVRL